MKIFVTLLFVFFVNVSEQRCNNQNCLECINGFECKVPINGRYINSEGLSLSCPSNYCIKCIETNVSIECLECKSGWIVDPNYSYRCIQCTNSTCKTCDSKNLSVCTSCKHGYQFTDESVCLKCNQLRCYNCGLLNSCPKCPAEVTDGYTFEAGYCYICFYSYCLQCPTNSRICSECNIGYGVRQMENHYDKNCSSCTVANCRNCSFDYQICEECKDDFGLNEEDKCVQCSSNCQKCIYQTSSTNQTEEICLYCIEGYGFNEEGVCELCRIKNCALCQDLSVCILCKNGYGLTDEGACEKCHSNCICKPTNVTFCTSCIGGGGWTKIQNGPCRKGCYSDHCAQCSTYFTCKECELGFGVQELSSIFHSCEECENENCSNCSLNYTHCLECKTGFGLNGPICEICEVGCLDCLSNYEKCVKCDEDSLFQLHNFQCIHCDVDFCLECHTKDGRCSVCEDGYSNKSDGQCGRCPEECTLCYFESSNDTTVCTECIEFYETKNGECKEICGDEVIITFKCDQPIGIQFDGCDDECNVEKDFICNITEENKSICSYTDKIKLTFDSFTEAKTMNEFTLIVSVEPPLHIFSVMSDEHILESFSLGNTEMQITKANYNKEEKKFTFIVNILSEIESTSFLLEFLNQQRTVKEFTDTPNVTEEMSFDFSNINSQFGKVMFLVEIAKYLCYSIICLSWISVFIGIILKNTFGLESMFVVQFFFLTFLWMNFSFVSMYNSVLPLKYSFGYNYGHFIQEKESELSEKAPFTSQFEMSDSFLVNNFSFLFALLSLSIIASFRKQTELEESKKKEINSERKAVIDKHSQKEKESDISDTKEEEEEILEQKLSEKLDLCLNILFQCVLISLIPFINFTVILFTNNKITEISNIIFFSLTVCIIIFGFSMFYFFPFRFVHLLLFYKKTFVSQNFCNVHIFVIISMTISLCVFPSLSFLPFIFLGTMILFTVTVRPFEEMKNNVRSIFNCLVMCIFIGSKYYEKNTSNLNLTQNPTALIILITVSLCLLNVIVSLVFHVLRYAEKIKSKKSNVKISSKDEKMHLEILKHLVKTDVRKKVGHLKSNYFKDVVSPKISIREFSKQLKEKMKTDFETKSPIFQYEQRIPFDFDVLNWNKVDHNFEKQESSDSEKILLKEKREKKLKITELCVQNEETFIEFKGCKEKILEQSCLEEFFIDEYNNLESEMKNEETL